MDNITGQMRKSVLCHIPSVWPCIWQRPQYIYEYESNHQYKIIVLHFENILFVKPTWNWQISEINITTLKKYPFYLQCQVLIQHWLDFISTQFDFSNYCGQHIHWCSDIWPQATVSPSGCTKYNTALFFFNSIITGSHDFFNGDVIILSLIVVLSQSVMSDL